MSELTKDYYKPIEVARMLNITSRTVFNKCEQGELDYILTDTKRRLIKKESVVELLLKQNMIYEDDDKVDVIYARVSTNKQKSRGDLDRQIDKLKLHVSTLNPKNLQVFKDVSSGLNDNRKELNKLLDKVMNNEVDRIFVLHKDRLTRFGFNYLKKICDKYNTEIVIVSNELTNKTIEEELADDIISVIHSFSGKLYGLRGKVKNKVNKELDNASDKSNKNNEEIKEN